MSATARDLATRLVMDTHWEWFNSMPLNEKLIFLLYSVRFGVECDHMSDKARQSCRDDAEAFVAALDAAGFAIVPKNELKHWQCDGLFCDATNKPDDEDCWKCGLSRMNV